MLHHNYANITGHDDDIDLGILGRLSPHQRQLPFHRYQQYYLWALYGFLPMKWQLYDDFRDLAVGRVGGRRFARPKGWDLAVFLIGKGIFFSLALALPLIFHPLWAVLLFYLAASLVQGTTLSVVFQLAHCVEEAEFPVPNPETTQMSTGWAAHQVESTVDFARRNRLLSWYIGALNFQIEHHLFPRICHVHYAALAPLVEATCREFGLKYSAHRILPRGSRIPFPLAAADGQAHRSLGMNGNALKKALAHDPAPRSVSRQSRQRPLRRPPPAGYLSQ